MDEARIAQRQEELGEETFNALSDKGEKNFISMEHIKAIRKSESPLAVAYLNSIGEALDTRNDGQGGKGGKRGRDGKPNSRNQEDAAAAKAKADAEASATAAPATETLQEPAVSSDMAVDLPTDAAVATPTDAPASTSTSEPAPIPSSADLAAPSPTLPSPMDVDSQPSRSFVPDLAPIRATEKKRLDWRGKLYLAPLTTVGNGPFRRLCGDYGNDISCSEMGLAQEFMAGEVGEGEGRRGERKLTLFRSAPRRKCQRVEFGPSSPERKNLWRAVVRQQATSAGARSRANREELRYRLPRCAVAFHISTFSHTDFGSCPHRHQLRLPHRPRLQQGGRLGAPPTRQQARPFARRHVASARRDSSDHQDSQWSASRFALSSLFSVVGLTACPSALQVQHNSPVAHKIIPRFQKEWGVSAMTVSCPQLPAHFPRRRRELTFDSLDSRFRSCTAAPVNSATRRGPTTLVRASPLTDLRFSCATTDSLPRLHRGRHRRVRQSPPRDRSRRGSAAHPHLW